MQFTPLDIRIMVMRGVLLLVLFNILLPYGKELLGLNSPSRYSGTLVDYSIYCDLPEGRGSPTNHFQLQQGTDILEFRSDCHQQLEQANHGDHITLIGEPRSGLFAVHRFDIYAIEINGISKMSYEEGARQIHDKNIEDAKIAFIILLLPVFIFLRHVKNREQRK